MGKKAGVAMSVLFVGNLTWTTEDAELRDFIAKYGTVTSCDTGDVRNGRKRGWAIVEMGTPAEATYVVEALNGVDFDGRALNIRPDAKPEKGSGGGGQRRERS